MAPKKNKKGNKKGGSGLSSPTPGFSASSSKAPEDLTIGTTGKASSSKSSPKSPKSPESKIPIITTPATPRSPPRSAGSKSNKDKLAAPTSPPKKLFAPLGDGELTPKPLKFGKNENADTTPKASTLGDRNPYGAAEFLKSLARTTRVGDDFVPQEPLQIMMAADGSGGDGNQGTGDGNENQQ